jgi:hypothetical protein
MWFSVCRVAAESFGLYFPALPFCLRQEEGEHFGRRHFHVLLGGLPKKAVTIQTCMALKTWWEGFLPRLNPKTKKWFEVKNPSTVAGGGMARIRLFDPALNGVDYVTKCLCLSGADAYESAKFGCKSSGLILSKGAEKILGRVIREDRRHIKRVDKRAREPLAPVEAGSSVEGLNHHIRSSRTCAPQGGGSPPALS